MTITQFENGYWYATELKTFAEAIGIPSANKLRKDELEKAIISFLGTGTLPKPKPQPPRKNREPGRRKKGGAPNSVGTTTPTKGEKKIPPRQKIARENPA